MSKEKWNEDHMKILDFQSIECPYMNIGCKNCHFVNTDMRNHMLMEIVYHSKFLIEFIDNLRNEIKTVKEDKIGLEKNVGDLKKCIKYLQLKYENNDEEIKKKLKEMEDKSNEEQKINNESKLKYDSDNNEIRKKLKQIENKLVEEDKNVIELKTEMKRINDEKESMKEDVAENKKSINNSKLKCVSESREIKEKINKIENKSDEQEKLINNSKLKCVSESREIKEKIKEIENKSDKQEREIVIKIDEINEIMVDLKSISKKSDKTISVLQNQMRIFKKKQEQQSYGELIWYIDNWKEKTEQARANSNKAIYSDVFYSHKNGYKMCLSLWPDGMICCKGTHLSIACNVIPGEYDENLMWPFKHDVTFQLINQHTNRIHTSCTLRYNEQHTLDNGEIDLFSSSNNNVSGTTIKYIAPKGTDEILKNNRQVTILTTFTCISGMKEYESKSLEELRYEDYLANRLYPQQSFLFDSGDVQTILGLFNSQSSIFQSMNYYKIHNRKAEINDGINWICRNRKFISLEELSNDNSLIDNDQILIKCKVTIKDTYDY